MPFEFPLLRFCSEKWKEEEEIRGKEKGEVGRRRGNAERIRNEPGRRIASAFLMSLKCKCKRDIITGERRRGRKRGEERYAALVYATLYRDNIAIIEKKQASVSGETWLHFFF